MKNRYGKWLILRLADNQEALPAFKKKYICQCDCGEEAEVIFESLKCKRSTQCRRCGRKQAAEKRSKYHLMNGQQFGKWTVIEKKNIHRHTLYACKCECGIIKNIRANRLVGGETKSCRRCRINGRIFKKIARLQETLIA